MARHRSEIPPMRPIMFSCKVLSNPNNKFIINEGKRIKDKPTAVSRYDARSIRFLSKIICD